MEQYKILAECLLPNHMLDWFELKDVQVKAKGDTQIVTCFLMRMSKSQTIAKTCVRTALPVRACSMIFLYAVMKFFSMCAAAVGLTQMVTML